MTAPSIPRVSAYWAPWEHALHTFLVRVHGDRDLAARFPAGVDAGPCAPALEAITAHLPHTLERRRATRAIAQAVTLYVLHQGRTATPLHRPDGTSIGAACRDLSLLIVPEGTLVRRRRRTRFDAAVEAATTDELVARLHGLMPELRGRCIALDHVRLAKDLLWWETPVGHRYARNRWEEDFHDLGATPFGDGEPGDRGHRRAPAPGHARGDAATTSA
ncbi:type I-E CRISPR-associated protein Cse2/CasB [Embleya scabrispora]|uniref:type I-E CRISPR-associated protein Cse2/CasB n=1 Tax=Embleya scabrispora TaxID=159449 RepID=UPI00036FDF55|nr:type I-E CRISPR-associated protein Cse2/CasB [Embleya scabrispora]MYS85940.1 type I-E CRISPR-associated protein Cse2/CasB [Streptomyces sp. SID5474]